jgi:multidrug efflux pump
VFIPILLMGGYVGRLFREFAVTLSAAILVSLLVSLTTTPALCASLLRARDVRRPAGRGFIFPRLRRGYAASLRWALRHSTLMLLLLVVTIALNVYLYVVIPKGFFPSQDTGRLYASVRGDQSASFQSTRIKLTDAINIVKDDPGVENVTGWTGSDARGFGMMFITLKPLEERKASAESIAARLRMKLANQAGVAIYVTPTQEVRVGGRDSDATFDYTLKSDDLDLLRYWTPRLERALRGVPQLVDVSSDQQTRGLQATLVIDRPTAARLGVTPDAIDTTLNLAFGQAIVGTMYSTLNQYRVVMEVDPRYAQDPEALKGVYVNSANGDQIPLSAFSRYEYTNTPVRVSHEGQFAAATISFSLPQGVALSEAIAKIEETMARIGVPTSIEGSFSGTAKAFRAALASQPWLILAALITMYIVLGVLYESYVHPLTILSTLPSAGVGALLALVAFKVEFSVMALIGVFLLIGIVKKNAIMMIDFALEAERREGKSPEEAILEAAVLRFRPIMMTTMAAILGALPLALGTGLGSELRQPLGIAVVGGLVMSQLLTLYTTPVVYLALDRLRWRWARAHGRDLRGVPV